MTFQNDSLSFLRFQRDKKIRSFIANKIFIVNDLIDGKNIKALENLIHFHPECEINFENNKVIISRNDIKIFILYKEKMMNVEKRDWFYVPEFGKILDSKMLVVTPISYDLHELYYFIVPDCYLKFAEDYLLYLRDY